MVLALTEAFKRAVSGLRCKAVYLATLRIGAQCTLAINNYALGSGDSITITRDGVNQVLVAGVDFALGASNSACAQNVAIAINGGAGATNGPAFQNGARVLILGASTVASITVTTTDTAFASSSSAYPPLPRDYNFVSGELEIFGYPPSIADVKPVSLEKNPLTKQITISDVEVRFKDDGLLRDILKRSRIKNKKLTLKIGTPDIALTDFAPAGGYIVTDYTTDYGQIVLSCKDAAQAKLQDNELRPIVGWTGDWVNKHGLEVLRETLEQSLIPAEFYDAASLDPTAVAYNDIEHWNITRTDKEFSFSGLARKLTHNGALKEPTKAFELIDSLMAIMPGQFAPDESGVSSFKRFDRNAATVRTWTTDNFDPSPPETYLRNLFNRVDITLAQGTDSDPTPTLRSEEQVSQRINATSLSEVHIAPYSFDTAWLNGTGFAHTAEPDPDGNVQFNPITPTTTHFLLDFAGAAGFAGCRFAPTVQPPANTSPIAGSELNSAEGRTLLLKFESPDNGWRWVNGVRQGGFEIIEIDQIDQVAGAIEMSSGFFPIQVRCRIKTRGMYGTTIPDLWNSASQLGPVGFVTDVTQAKYIEDQLLDRWKNGVPTVSGWTPLSEMDVQLGDFVEAPIKHYINLDEDGLVSTAVWEVVSKEIRALDNTPGVFWKLAWVRDVVSAAVSIVVTDVPVELQTADDCTVYDNEGNVVTDNNGATVRIC